VGKRLFTLKKSRKKNENQKKNPFPRDFFLKGNSMQFYPEAVLEVVSEVTAAEKQAALPSVQRDEAKVHKMTDYAVTHGAAKAMRMWKKEFIDDHVSKSSFQKYKKFFCDAKKAGKAIDDCYYVPKRRGRPPALDEHEDLSLVQAIALLRSEGKAISAGTVSAAARGIVRRLRPGVIEESLLDLGPEWAASWMKVKGLCVRAAQTDRSCTGAEVRKSGSSADSRPS